MLKLASWNVNSLKIRLEQVLAWLATSAVDVLAIQETKITDENFPQAPFNDRGYHVAFAGQKSYNGVAIISRLPLTEVVTDIPNFYDPQRRILAATIGDLRLINLYVPNGSTVSSEKYAYKLIWMQKITSYIQAQCAHYAKLAVMGDFNVAPEDRDVHDPSLWEGCVLASAAERQAFHELLQVGLVDSFRHFIQEEKQFSWWDYRAGAFRRNRGLRIDHLLLSHELIPLCKTSQIDKIPRTWPQPSDHAPVWLELDLPAEPDSLTKLA